MIYGFIVILFFKFSFVFGFGFGFVKLCTNRPGFDRDDFAANGHIFLDIDRPINGMIPNGRIVGPIDHIDLHFDGTRQWRIALVLGHRL